ncbi:hypothetical protein C8J55DRAFT_520652 [Lentinula edodes]|uniref:Uncharacterized protein n=1 Tax=Lentinula lateritia TaxID=40482 RepID=A0A9W9A0D7_9AGAR|nr:hypothetical protein C8J55DRAFT_520652 [Lentinula edodes]
MGKSYIQHPISDCFDYFFKRWHNTIPSPSRSSQPNSVLVPISPFAETSNGESISALFPKYPQSQLNDIPSLVVLSKHDMRGCKYHTHEPKANLAPNLPCVLRLPSRNSVIAV